MAIGKKSDFVIFNDEEFEAGMMEALVSSANMFNQASLGTIVLDPATPIRGDYRRRSFLDQVTAPTRRDDTSTATATDTALTMDEEVGVKVKRKFGPFAQTHDAWRAVGSNSESMSTALGRAYGEHKIKEMRNTAVLCLETAISGVTALNFDATGESTKTLTVGHMNSGLAKFGDAQGELLFWLLHSKPWNDVVAQGISDKVDTIYSGVLTNHRIPGLGRPFGVQDITALHDDNGSLTDTYNVLCLRVNAVTAVESAADEIAFERITGLENLVSRFQAEYEYVVTVRGFRWDITNGGANPTGATIGTTSNWDKAVAEDKNLAGIRVKVQ